MSEYHLMGCFSFQMLDGSVKEAETGQSEEEKNEDREKLYHDIHCNDGILGM